MSEINKKVISLIDADFLLYYATMGRKVTDEFGVPIKKDNKFVYTDKTLDEVYYTADVIIKDLLNTSGCNSYIGYIGNSESFRYDDYPDYKANRKNLEKPKYFQELKDYLVNTWKFELLNNNLEADDAVNIARNILKDSFNVIIITNDKDLCKCIPGKYLNPKNLEFIRTSKEKAKEAFWTSMISGDSTDNIKGQGRPLPI